MLAPNLDQKVVPHSGSRLLPPLIVRTRGRLVVAKQLLVSATEARTTAPALRERGPHPGFFAAQWHPFRSERDFWRFARSHLRGYFPALPSQCQFNRRVRALEPEMRALQQDLAEALAEPSALYRVLDTSLIPAVVRVRASGKELFPGQATFGRSASKTEWIHGFKVALERCGLLVGGPREGYTSLIWFPNAREEVSGS